MCFIITKRKYNTEVESQQIRNISEAFDTYKKMSEEALESQRTQMESTINMHSMKIEELQKENQALRKQVSELQKLG